MFQKLTVKDLATIGIFSAVMIVVFITFSMLTGASLFFNMIFNGIRICSDDVFGVEYCGGISGRSGSKRYLCRRNSYIQKRN